MIFSFTLLKILYATALVGLISSMVGCFLLLQKKSLLGDTLAHSTLPGIACALLISFQKKMLYILIGATVSSLLSSLMIEYILHKTRLKKDAALGVVLSFMFGLGVMLLSIIQKHPVAQQAGINNFLLGNAATILMNDLYIISFLALVICTSIYCFWREFMILAFDQQQAENMQMPVKKIQAMFTVTTVLTILIGLQTVGIILMSALLIAPAAAAQQWTDRITTMMQLSALLSIIATTTGAIISFYIPRTPTGPAIVIVITMIAFSSIIYKCYTDQKRQNSV
jgi:manganese/zinc/iron transport system permease protein